MINVDVPASVGAPQSTHKSSIFSVQDESVYSLDLCKYHTQEIITGTFNLHKVFNVLIFTTCSSTVHVCMHVVY